MRSVGVSVRDGDIGHIGKFDAPRILQMVEGRPEAPDASIKLRRDADSFRKEPLQLPLAKIAGASKIAHF